MRQQRNHKLLSLFLALVMLLGLAVPAFAADGEEGPARELRMDWLDWDEEGRCYANEDTLNTSMETGTPALGFNPTHGDYVIFFIWNNETQRKERFVVPEGNDDIRVIPVDSQETARGARQTQYYVRLEMDEWKDTTLTYDGLTLGVTAMMDDFAFFSSQTFSPETYLGHEVDKDTLTDNTVYFGNSYAGTEEAGQRDKVVSVEKEEDGNAKLYTLEKTGDDCWKIVYQDVFDTWGDIGVGLKLKVRQPDGETREDGRSVYIYKERAPQLWFLPLGSEWSEEEDRDYFFVDPNMGPWSSSADSQLRPGEPVRGVFGTDAQYDDNGFVTFTPVSVEDVKLPEGLTANADVPAKEGAKWAEYYVELSADDIDKEYTITYGDFQLTLNSGLPDIGLYTAPEASWKNWAGPYEFPYNPIYLDKPYYIISTATDERHGRHLTGLSLSDWEENAFVELTEADGVYKLTLKQEALNHDRFHLELDLTWADPWGNTWTDTGRYLGDFCVKNAAVASDVPLTDGTAKAVSPIPYPDVADKVSTSVTMTAGESKELYLYRVGFRWSASSFDVIHLPYQNYFHSASKELTLVQDEADFSKFTLSCAKPGVYELYIASQEYDWDNLRLYHAGGTEYTQEEFDKFYNELRYSMENGVLVIYDEDFNPTPFTEMFPGETYVLEPLGLFVWEDYCVTVTVEPGYTDVAADDWFYDDVVFASVNGMMNGDGQRFNPKGQVTREMVPTVLYRLAGEPETAAGDFADVAAGAWYADAVNWAAETGVVKGMGGDSFGVGTRISREQLAAMLYRYAEYLGCDMSVSGDLSGFADADSVHSWAAKEMQWAVGAGIINGKGDRLDPQGAATRAELAVMLARFCRDVL